MDCGKFKVARKLLCTSACAISQAERSSKLIWHCLSGVRGQRDLFQIRSRRLEAGKGLLYGRIIRFFFKCGKSQPERELVWGNFSSYATCAVGALRVMRAFLKQGSRKIRYSTLDLGKHSRSNVLKLSNIYHKN
jgi:hypothetical protein